MRNPGAIAGQADVLDVDAYVTLGNDYLCTFLRGMMLPLQWKILKRWANEQTRARAQRVSPWESRPDAELVEVTGGIRDQKLAQLWDALHTIGFRVVDHDGTAIESLVPALTSDGLHLVCPSRAPMRPTRRVGFITHSLTGNALMLLTMSQQEVVSRPNEQQVRVRDIARQPNRNYLLNGVPMDTGNFVIIRHCETRANEQQVLLGRSNGAEGWESELVDPSPRPCPPGVQAWYRSSLTRTELTARAFGIDDAIACLGLDEMDIGAAEGTPERACHGRFPAVQRMHVHGDPFAAIVDEVPTGGSFAAGECFVEVLLRAHECLHREAGFVSNL